MKNKVIAIALLLVFAFGSVFICELVLLPHDPLLNELRYIEKPILSESEISELREIYPKKVYEDNPLIDSIKTDNKDRIQILSAETYMYCEITEEPLMDMKNFSVSRAAFLNLTPCLAAVSFPGLWFCLAATLASGNLPY